MEIFGQSSEKVLKIASSLTNIEEGYTTPEMFAAFYLIASTIAATDEHQRYIVLQAAKTLVELLQYEGVALSKEDKENLT